MTNIHTYKTGFICGIIAFAATIAFIISQLLQLLGILVFPYDEILIYSTSMLITIPFLLEILAVHYIAVPDKKIWSHAALLFTLLYVVFVTANYVVQLGVVIPAILQGQNDKVELLRQLPHSFLWYFDGLGYIFMGIAVFFVHLVLHKEGIQGLTRTFLFAHSITTPIVAYVYINPDYSDDVLLLALPWAITAPTAMLLLAIVFHRKYRIELPNHRYLHKDLN